MNFKTVLLKKYYLIFEIIKNLLSFYRKEDIINK